MRSIHIAATTILLQLITSQAKEIVGGGGKARSLHERAWAVRNFPG